MILEYVHLAMERAHYEILTDDNTYYGEIKLFPGVWANAKTLEDCRNELAETLEEWILLRLRTGKKIPSLKGIDLEIHKKAA